MIEMTEVVALVFAFGAEQGGVRHGAWGAVSGTTLVAGATLAFGVAIVSVPRDILLWSSAVVLAGFGVFLFRSTLRSYRRALAPIGPRTAPSTSTLKFAGGFSVGVIESVETVIVLIPLAAAGNGFSALLGAGIAGAILVVTALFLHERVRKIKVPTLKLAATALLFSFAIFWGGEAARVSWPGSDLILVPFVLAGALIVRAAIGLFMAKPVPVETKG